jgi:hypothetical protein
MASSSMQESRPFCDPEAPGCVVSRQTLGEVWVPEPTPSGVIDTPITTQTVAGFDPNEPCPTISLVGSGIDFRLMENQVSLLFRVFPNQNVLTTVWILCQRINSKLNRGPEGKNGEQELDCIDVTQISRHKAQHRI